jgi:CHAT domain-containing protein
MNHFCLHRALPISGACAAVSAVALVALLSGCQSPGGAGAQGGVSFAAGENTIGEACRVRGGAPHPDVPQAAATFATHCGEWEEPSARIIKTEAGVDPRVLAQDGWWRARLDQFLNCEEPIATTILDGVAAVALDCAFRTGGWPFQALAVRIGGDVWLGDSTPAAYPVMERAIGVLAGRLQPAQASDTGRISAEIERLEALLAGGQYSIGALQQYRELLRLGQYYNFRGQYAEAEKQYRRALELQEETLGGDAGGLAFLSMHLGLEASNQGLFERANRRFEQAEAELSASLEPTDEARLLSYRAIHAANQRRDGEAEELARRATELRRQIAREYGRSGPEADLAQFLTLAGGQASAPVLSGRGVSAFGDIVQSRYTEAYMLIEKGKLDQAEEALREAREIMDREPRVPRKWLPEIMILQAKIAAEKGNLGRAERLLLAAMQQQSALFRSSRTEAQAHLALGQVYARQGRRSEALSAFHTGFAIYGEQKQGIRMADAWPYFDLALTQGRGGGDLAKQMLDVAQLVRGPVVAQTMAVTAARLAASEKEVGGLIRALQDAQRQRDRIQEQFAMLEADPQALAPHIDQLRQQWQAASARIADLERQVQSAAPRYNQLIDAPVAADDVIASLQPGEAIVQILLGPEGSVGFLVDGNGIEAWRIALSERQVAEQVSALRYPFEATDTLPPFATDASHELYRQLLAPVASRLAVAQHVIIVPSGALLSLPFAVLVEQPPSAGGDNRTVAWMVRNHALTLSPSVQSFVNLRRTVQPSRAPRAFAGFADFVPYSDSQAVLRSLDLPGGCQTEAQLIAALPPLPNTRAEVRAIAGALDAPDPAIVAGSEFTKEALQSMDLGDYRIAYFATHGLLPYTLECVPEPALIVSVPPQGGTDGLLTASEVTNLELDANLVVLSACNTGGPGLETGGEALSGLARSFFYAGARSMLVTHWEIPDQATVELMVGTFKGAAAGQTTAAALREGQLRLINDPATSHPFYWAAFTVVGDGGQRVTPGLAAPATSRVTALSHAGGSSAAPAREQLAVQRAGATERGL